MMRLNHEFSCPSALSPGFRNRVEMTCNVCVCVCVLVRTQQRGRGRGAGGGILEENQQKPTSQYIRCAAACVLQVSQCDTSPTHRMNCLRAELHVT